MPSSHPVIVVPGVTATYLRDLYPLPPETIWAVIRKKFDRVQLHPDDTRYEARQPAIVRSDQLYEISYQELIEELRYNLSDREDDPVPVFPFSYDWRHPLHVIEAQLADFVDEVIDRTKLLPKYYAAGYGEAPKVNLIGHSMGGLVVAGYLESHGAGKVGKVASLAAPFGGSFEAMVKMTTGTATIGGSTPSSREREASRLTPSLYHLLPSFDTGIGRQPHAGLPNSTFDSELWQPSIIDTIVEYVRLHGRDPDLPPDDRERQGREIFERLLAGAGEHRARLDALDLGALGFDTGRWLCVIGVDSMTRVRMLVEREDGRPVFRLSSRDRLNHWGHESEARRKLTGDGTVHFKAAVPKFLPYESLVCVSPDDYGYWEPVDAVLTRLGGFHGILPNMNMLHRLLVRHFTGRGDPRGNTWGRPPPGVATNKWKPPVQPLRAK